MLIRGDRATRADWSKIDFLGRREEFEAPPLEVRHGGAAYAQALPRSKTPADALADVGGAHQGVRLSYHGAGFCDRDLAPLGDRAAGGPVALDIVRHPPSFTFLTYSPFGWAGSRAERSFVIEAAQV